MKRRKFIYTIGGSLCFFSGLEMLKPQESQAIIFIFFIKTVAGISLMNLALGGLALAALGSSRTHQEIRSWYDDRLEAQLAQREFIRRSFTDVSLARNSSSQSDYVMAAYKEEALGTNVALAFPRVTNGTPAVSVFSGPFSIGMSVAAQYLREHERLVPHDVQAAIFPRRRGGVEYVNWKSWSSSGMVAYPNTFSDAGVRIRYEAVEPRVGGFGVIDVLVHAHRIIQIPQIKVEFS